MDVNSIEFDNLINARVVIKKQYIMLIGSHYAINTGYYFTTKAEIGPYVAVISELKSELIVEDFV